MNIEQLIIKYLQQYGTAKIQDFGTFSLENVEAIFNTESDKILPPSQIIVFNFDDKTLDKGFIQYISKEEKIFEQEASQKLNEYVNFWKKSIENRELLSLKSLGKFSRYDDEIIFKGERIISENSEFYGLEAINLQDLKNQKEDISMPQKDYKLSQSLFWIFLLIILIGGLIFLGIIQQERIFGKKSFDDLPLKKHRIDSKTTQKKDSIRNHKTYLPLDSVKDYSRKNNNIK